MKNLYCVFKRTISSLICIAVIGAALPAPGFTSASMITTEPNSPCPPVYPGDILFVDPDAGTDAKGALFKIDPVSRVMTMVMDFGDLKDPHANVRDPRALVLSRDMRDVYILDRDLNKDLNGKVLTIDLIYCKVEVPEGDISSDLSSIDALSFDQSVHGGLITVGRYFDDHRDEEDPGVLCEYRGNVVAFTDNRFRPADYMGEVLTGIAINNAGDYALVIDDGYDEAGCGQGGGEKPGDPKLWKLNVTGEYEEWSGQCVLGAHAVVFEPASHNALFLVREQLIRFNVENKICTKRLNIGWGHKLAVDSSGNILMTKTGEIVIVDAVTFTTKDRITNLSKNPQGIAVVPPGPMAHDDNYIVHENNTFTVDAPGLLANDIPLDSALESTYLVDSVRNGSLNLNEDGSFSYTPVANFVGMDSFTYYASDNEGRLSNVATVYLTVTAPGSIDLSITKLASPNPVAAGANLTYTLDVVNQGTRDATDVMVTDMLPAGVTLVSASPSQGDCYEGLSCNLGSVASGATATVTIVAAVQSSVSVGEILTNTAEVSTDTPESDLTNNTASVFTTIGGPSVVRSANLVLKLDVNRHHVRPGENVVFLMNVENRGEATALDVTFSKQVPDPFNPVEFYCVPPATLREETCYVDTLAPGETVTGIAVLTPIANPADADTQFMTSATVESSTPDANEANNTDQVEIIIVNPDRPDLSPVIPPAGQEEYCVQVAPGEYGVAFSVRNQGSQEARASVAAVEFRMSDRIVTADVPIPAIATGESFTPGTISTPPGCFATQDCAFIITLDVTERVNEKLENNNSTKGFCEA